MGAAIPLLTFSVDGQRFGLPIDAVARVVRAVELTELPGAPPPIRGVFSWHGRIVPTGDVRPRLGRPAREVDVDDHIIITHVGENFLAVLADGTTDVITIAAEEIVTPQTASYGADVIAGIVHLPDGMVFIQDLAKFLTPEERATLTEALHAYA